jgi:hypothetical protein
MKCLFLSLLILLVSANLSAQKVTFQVGSKTLHEVHANGLLNLENSHKLGIGVSYYIAIADELYMDQGGVFPMEYLIIGLNQQGFGLSIFHKSRSLKKEKRWNQYTIEYQRLSSGNYIRDEGKSGGSTQETYQEFKEKYHNISLVFSRHIDMGTNGKWELVWEYGGTLKFVERTYTIDGNYSNKNPSDKIENLISGAPVFRFGFNYKL